MHLPKARNVAITLAVIAVIIGVALAFAQDQETLRIKSTLSVEDARYADYLADILGHQLTSGDSYIVHTNGDRAFPAMLSAIDQAKSRVSLESYIYEDGDIGTRFTSALVKAAGRGVAVRMVLDSVGSKKLSKESTERLRAAGVKVGWVNPLVSYSLEEANYRTHRKVLIVDGEMAFVGGMGIADQWAHDTEDFPRWRDTQIEIHGPVISNLESAFNQNWIMTGGVVDPQVKRPPAGGGEARSIVVWSAPQGGANEMKILYLMAIAAARRTLDIQSPYLITDESTQWSLHDARQRGVRIRLLVEGDKTDAKSVKAASRAEYETLLADGIEIAEYQPTMMHTKATIVDGVMSIVGSANFDNRSLELNEELNVAVFSPALAQRLSADFERDLAVSKRLMLAEWRSRPAYQRAREWLWSYFGEVF
jgi:cardiolipin synthase